MTLDFGGLSEVRHFSIHKGPSSRQGIAGWRTIQSTNIRSSGIQRRRRVVVGHGREHRRHHRQGQGVKILQVKWYEVAGCYEGQPGGQEQRNGDVGYRRHGSTRRLEGVFCLGFWSGVMGEILFGTREHFNGMISLCTTWY